MKNETVKYIKAKPEFKDIDTEEDGKKLLAEIEKSIKDLDLSSLVLDISECYLDYWGCAPVIAGCLKIFQSENRGELRQLAVLTTMEFGSKSSYSSLFFKGTEYEKESEQKDFSRIAVNACRQAGVELKIWIIQQPYVFEGIEKLQAPKFVLSSM